MPSKKCKNCNSTDIETDPARGDAICTNCGCVLEDQLIVSETVFEETASGGMTVVGEFVSNDSSGGATGFGASYHVNGKKSREITLQNARKGIAHLCQQLRMNSQCIDISLKFYDMALTRQLTRGRKQVHNHAACVYLTCRIEALGPMLIDISDVLQIDVNELGRTYLKFAQAFDINIPSIDPCLYIMRFAEKLDLGDQTTVVANTALRLVQRMKRDSIHSGRRPSGLCGAALVMAARLHEFNRTPGDIVKIVKVHESTVRKRMNEFGDTPSSYLTLDEFMTVDLEEEQDPPAFKAARKKDRERLQRLENFEIEFDDLQNEINKQLDKHITSRRKRTRDNDSRGSDNNEDVDIDHFIHESNLNAIQSCVDDPDSPDTSPLTSIGLGPNIASLNLPSSIHEIRSTKDNTICNAFENESGELDITDIDDDELDEYILTNSEANSRETAWNSTNATYLKEQEEKEELRLKEKEEGKPEKKKRRSSTKKKNQGPANSAGEAIEKMLQEKRISTKINYEVLKSLNIGSSTTNIIPKPNVMELEEKINVITASPKVNMKPRISINVLTKAPRKTNEFEIKSSPRKRIEELSVSFKESEVASVEEAELADGIEDEEEHDELNETNEMSVAQMLHGNIDDDDDYGYNCEDDY